MSEATGQYIRIVGRPSGNSSWYSYGHQQGRVYPVIGVDAKTKSYRVLVDGREASVRFQHARLVPQGV
jgi:glucose dehydrogenase